MLKPRRFSCLYFPYADPEPSPAVLTAALLFDDVYFLEPDFFRKPKFWGDDERVFALNPSLEALDVFKRIGPNLVGFEDHHIPGRALSDTSVTRELQSSILADLQNEALTKLVGDVGKVYWSIPNGQYLFWNGLGLLLDSRRASNTKFEAEVFTQRVEFYSKYFGDESFVSSVRSFDEARIRNPRGELMVRLPFLPVQALMIAVALHACREFGLVPFTDSLIHHKYLSAKLRQVTASCASSPDATISGLLKGVDYSKLGESLIELSVPQIEGLTPEKVARLRDRRKGELAEFRLELVALSYEIGVRPWDDEYDYEIAKVIGTKVQPALKKLRDSLAAETAEFGIKLLERAVTTAPLPLALAIVPGFPIEWALPGSVGAVWLKEFASYYLKRSAAKKNGLHFLLHFEK